MWIRSEIKEIGKTNFKNNYWKSVLVAFIYQIFFTATFISTSKKREQIGESYYSDPDKARIIGIVVAAVGVIMLIMYLVDVFLFNPLEVGCNRFFLVNQDAEADVSELAYGYKNGYFRTVIAIFLRDLLKAIGFALCVIPGLILHYSYRMVPFVLSEDPSVSCIDALKRSRMMMKGQKWKAFVFDLSFIGWYLLTFITCGIVSFFYVHPYKMNADAALYKAVRKEYGL
ncbi:MAG: DUF975 family protein [Lachnospiraceae bacterium]|nr:DUF975 family protein [Lachnospiraceae bacterium]